MAGTHDRARPFGGQRHDADRGAACLELYCPAVQNRPLSWPIRLLRASDPLILSVTHTATRARLAHDASVQRRRYQYGLRLQAGGVCGTFFSGPAHSGDGDRRGYGWVWMCLCVDAADLPKAMPDWRRSGAIYSATGRAQAPVPLWL